MKRILTGILVLLTLALCFSVPVHADDSNNDPTQADNETGSWIEDLRLMYDEGSIPIEVAFDLSTVGQTGYWEFEYNDDWFKQSAENYNHKLARLTFGMAISSFRPNFDPDTQGDPATHVRDFFNQAGFTDLRMDDYDKNPSLYTVSTLMAHKHIDDENGGFEVLAIGICGGGYQNEWLSNFTIGDETLHVGFNSAAGEVFDRVFGYIAQNQLTGRNIKIWFGGFSRAAAISNVLATKLIDSKQFTTKNVYTYTFATPRTTKDPKPGQYPNIYNIVGKMDPVPSVPFADWGYERFGTTFYLPSQQTDSNYNIKQSTASSVYYDLVGTYWWNNVELDTKLRVLLNYMLKISPTSAVYKQHLQDHLIDIWGNKTVTNIMNELMQVAGNKELINDNNKTEANSLLTYIAYSAFGFATKSDIESEYMNENATIVGNLAHEHTPEVYLSWLFSSEKGELLYSNQLDYLRLVIAGNVDVALFDMDEEDGLVKAVMGNGDYEYEFTYDGKTYVSPWYASAIFMYRNKNDTILLIPKDANYKVVISSNMDQTVTLHGIQLRVGRTNGSFSKLYKLNMKKGGFDVIYSPRDRDLNGDGYYGIVNGDTFDVSTISRGDSTSFAVELERNNFLNLSWREIVVIAFTAPTVIFALMALITTWLVGNHRLKRKKNAGQIRSNAVYDKIPSTCITLCVAMFVLQEMAYWLMPDYLEQRGLLKLGISLSAIYLCNRGFSKQPTSLSRSIFIAMIVCCLGDVTINYSFMLGVFIFGIAILILCHRFYLYEKPEKWQYIMFAISSIGVMAYIIVNRQGSLSWTVAMSVYALALNALLILALTMPKRIRFGAICLTISNVLIFFNQIRGTSLVTHITSLAIDYVAIMCFAYSTRYKKPYENDDVSIIQKPAAQI
ncbi:MAG: hypothetical protein IJ115_10070 [Erysipelotrichaceae bacterium]|nr:hypothetical protein [Erysipelotrichaceae bacterium]